MVCSVSRYKKGEIIKMTGIGYLTGKDPPLACVSKKGSPNISVWEDRLQHFHRILPCPVLRKGAVKTSPMVFMPHSTYAPEKLKK